MLNRRRSSSPEFHPRGSYLLRCNAQMILISNNDASEHVKEEGKNQLFSPIDQFMLGISFFFKLKRLGFFKKSFYL